MKKHYVKLEPGTNLYRVTENQEMELYVESLTIAAYVHGDYVVTCNDGNQMMVLREDIDNVVFLNRQEAVDQLIGILNEYKTSQPREYYQTYAAWAVREGLYQIKEE